MPRLSKRQKEIGTVKGTTKSYTLEEAVAQIEKFPKTKFDETVDLHFMLGIDLSPSIKARLRFCSYALIAAIAANSRCRRLAGASVLLPAPSHSR